MKRILLLSFIFLAAYSYGQTVSTGKAQINIDSLTAASNKANKEAIGKQFPEFTIPPDNVQLSNSKLKAQIILDSLTAALNKANKEAIGKQFPAFTISSDKVQWSNSKLKEKIVYINFWFATCWPCVAEFDELNNLYAKFKDNENFVFISLTFENAEEIERIKAKYNIQYNVFSITNAECYRLNNHNGFPTSIIVDKSGAILYISAGGSLKKSEIEQDFADNIYPLISKNL